MYFKGSLNGLYLLGFMINNTCIFMEYETGAIADYVTLVNLLISLENSFSAFIQIYFQSFSEVFIGFTVCDTHYLCFFVEY